MIPFAPCAVRSSLAFLCWAAVAAGQGDSRPVSPELAASRATSRPTFKLYFVRHGEAVSNVRPLEQLSDEERNKLTPKGREQAAGAAARLKALAVNGFYTSPAGRARATAEVIATARGGPTATVEDDAAPLKDGVGADGAPFPISARMQAWRKGEDVRPKDGESLEDVRARAVRLVKRLAARHPGGAALLVAHGEVAAGLIAEANGETALARLLKGGVANAGIYVFELVDDRLRYVGPFEAPASR
jgi:broad specificity phosphatase PhoE